MLSAWRFNEQTALTGVDSFNASSVFNVPKSMGNGYVKNKDANVERQ
jgi:hypothetical protein